MTFPTKDVKVAPTVPLSGFMDTSALSHFATVTCMSSIDIESSPISNDSIVDSRICRSNDFPFYSTLILSASSHRKSDISISTVIVISPYAN